MAATVGDLPPKESGPASATAERKLPLPPPGHEAPWLFSLRPPHDTKKFSPTHDRAIAVQISTKNDGSARVVYDEEVPDKYLTHYIVTSEGNRLFLKSPEYPYRIYLVDPFSSWTIVRDLPRQGLGNPYGRDSPAHEVVNLVTHAGLAVATAGFDARSLVYMRLGSTGGWIARDKLTSLGHFTGLIACKDKDYGLFYALSRDHEKVFQLKFVDSSKIRGDDTDFEIQDMSLNLRCGFDPTHICNSGWCCLQEQARLVDSPSGPFLVRWRFLLKGTHTEREIDVYKLSVDEKRKEWVPVHSLDNFSFFLGFNQSLAASTEQFPDLRSDLIYIPYDCDYRKDAVHNLIYDVKNECWGHWDRRLGIEDRHFRGMQWPSVWMLPPGLENPALKRELEEQVQAETEASTSDSSGSSDIIM